MLASGKHSGHYVNKDAISTKPYVLNELAKAIADHFSRKDVQVVAAPAVGAITLGNRVAYHYGPDISAIFAEENKDGKFVFQRGYADLIQSGTKVLVVEDIVTTGKTTEAMIDVVRKLGGEMVGVGLLWNRSAKEFGGVPTYACVNQSFPTYSEEECTLCRQKVPINTKINKHGQNFIENHGEDPSKWPANLVF